MKKLLLTLIVSIAFCGSVFAQYNSDVYTSHWIDEWDVDTYCPYEDYDYIIPFLTIDGEYITLDMDYEAIELAAFIDGECRGHSFLIDDGETWPFTELAVYRDMADHDQTITFKLYDHANQQLYNGNTTLLNGAEYNYQELYFSGDYDMVPVLDFSLAEDAITKNIVGYDNGGHWYLISSPIGEVPVSDVENLTINKFDLYYFDQNGDENGKEWMNYELRDEEDNLVAGFDNLELGKGYLYANEADVTLKFHDAAYDGEGTFPLVYSEENADANMHGWNLMGNPYNAAVTVDRPFYRLVEDVFTSYEAGEVQIDPMEGVIVFTDGAEEESVTFTPATGGKTSTLALNLINGSKVIDRAIIGFGEGRTLPKFQFNSNSSKVYITIDNEDYAVVRSEGMGEMPVNFKAESNSTYSLSFNSNVEFSYLHLIDNLTGTDQDLLADPSYTFEAKTTDYASRFKLVFATGNDEDNFAFFSNGSLIINNEGNATLQVVDVTGRIIKCESINGCANVNIDAASGVYMVRLVNGDNVKVQKVVR